MGDLIQCWKAQKYSGPKHNAQVMDDHEEHGGGGEDSEASAKAKVIVPDNKFAPQVIDPQGGANTMDKDGGNYDRQAD